MKYTACPLYGIQSKKMLKYILHIKNEDLLKQERVASMISPYVDRSKKPRLIEPPQAELKAVQKRIKTLLGKIEVPNNVFSGILHFPFLAFCLSIYIAKNPIIFIIIKYIIIFLVVNIFCKSCIFSPLAFRTQNQNKHI